MIKTVLIDDERPALRGLEYLLKNYPEIEISGLFTNPLEAIDKIPELKPQVVFLDINMPQLQGIDAASKILDLCPETDIIFVTAYDQYALDAFELHALDYVLKPIVKERFEKTLQRVMKKKGIKIHGPDMRLTIKCLGRFQMGWVGEEPIRWRSEKTKELFAFLLHHQGQEVSKDKILEELWPETELEKAIHQLHNGIYYIRKTLEQYGIERALISILGNYSMELGVVDVDALLFQERLKRVNDSSTIEEIVAAETIYTGDYMEGADWPWADLERERLARKYSEVVVGLSQAYIEKKEFGKAEEYLVEAFNSNPFEEKITELLMNLYRITSNKVKATRHFNEYTRILREELGIKPQEKIHGLYSAVK